MAIIHMNFFSTALQHNTDVNVFIPTPKTHRLEDMKDPDFFHPGTKYKTLYLLHGAYGDFSDWLRNTNVERYAAEKNIALVMPTAENSFYQDVYKGEKYSLYVTEELPRLVRALFPLSDKREDNFTAGLSMGGYGALKMALTNPERYSAAISLSGVVDLGARINMELFRNYPFVWEDLFENPQDIGDADLLKLIKKQKAAGKTLPRIFQSCGTEDPLYKINRDAKPKLLELGVDLTYEEHPGIHDWYYWDTHIKRALNWLLPGVNYREEGPPIEDAAKA